MTNKEIIEKLKPLLPYLESAAFAKYVRMMYNSQINTLKEVYEAKGFKLDDKNCAACVMEMCSRLYQIFKKAEQEESEVTIQRPENVVKVKMIVEPTLKPKAKRTYKKK